MRSGVWHDGNLWAVVAAAAAGVLLAWSVREPSPALPLLLGASVALALAGLRRPILPFVVVVGLASVIGYRDLTQGRLQLGIFPVNAIDLACAASLPAFALSMRRRHTEANRTRYRAVEILFVIALLSLVAATLRAWFDDQSPYFVVRNARPVLFIVFAYLYTRYVVRTRADARLLILTVIAGGIFSVTVGAAQRLGHLLTLGDEGFVYWVTARNLVLLTAAGDFVLILPIVSVVYGYAIWQSHALTRLFAALSVFALLLSLNLTSYAYVFLVPVFAALFAEPFARRKVLQASAILAVPLALVLGSLVAGLLQIHAGPIDLFIQVAGKLANVTQTENFQGRLMTTQAALASLDSVGWLVGMGLGFRAFIDTGLTTVGVVAVGEASAFTFLLTLGLAGLIPLLALQVAMIFNARLAYRAIADSFDRVVFLTLAVYGCLLFVSSFLHNVLLTPQGSILFGAFLGFVCAAAGINELESAENTEAAVATTALGSRPA